MNEKEKFPGIANLRKAFEELNSMGWFARMNFECCQTCGWAAADKTGKENVVFFHSQSNEQLEEEGWCYLRWQGDVKTLLAVLDRYGITTHWNGGENTAILIDVTPVTIA